MAVPWLFVLLHFNLLIHLGLTSRKLKRFLDDLEPLDTELADRLRNDAANFPLAQWMVGRNDAVFRVVLTVLVWIMLVLIPPFLLLWMQLRFLAFQDETFTALQAAAVSVDALLIVGFRAWFVRQVQPQTRWIAGARELWKRRGLSLVLWARLLLTQPLFRYLIPLIPLGFAVFLSVGLSNILAAEKVASCGNRPESDDGILRHITWWHCRQYFLTLREKLLTDGAPSAQNVNALRGDIAAVGDRASVDMSSTTARAREEESDKQRNKALDAVLGLDLRERHLRGADLFRAVLPKADLRGAQMQGAVLHLAQLQLANLEGASLRDANLEGAWMHNTILEGAWMQGARLDFASLHGAILFDTQLHNASLWEAQLQSATLTGAQLQGANLYDAQLQDAWLGWAQLQDADLTTAQLQGAILREAQLQGADLRGANLDWADLTDADLSFARLCGEIWGGRLCATNLETAELAGADYVFADGLEGTFLDINQPPPDILPASCDPCSLSHLSPLTER